MQLSDAIQCWVLLAETEKGRLSPKTIAQYTDALERFLAFATSKNRVRLEEFTPNLLRAAMVAEMQEGHGANWKGGEGQANSISKAAKQMVKRLREEYPSLSLPDLSVVKPPKLPERIQQRLEDGEFGKLEAAVRLRLLRDRVPRFLIARDLAILEVLANTGLRASEMCALNVDDLNLDEGTVTVRRGKGGHWRILTVRDQDERDGGEVLRALGDYLRYRERTFGPGRTDALWLTQKGNRLKPDDLRDALRNLCDEAGIDGNRPPHAFRRSYFTDSYREQPLALPVLIERMGWHGGKMARVYTRGVDVELARRIPMPLMSKKWRNQNQNGTNGLFSPAGSDRVSSRAGPRAGGEERAALPSRGRVDRNRPPTKPAHRGPASLG